MKSQMKLLSTKQLTETSGEELDVLWTLGSSLGLLDELVFEHGVTFVAALMTIFNFSLLNYVEHCIAHMLNNTFCTSFHFNFTQ